MQKKSLLSLLILPVIWGGYYVATNAAVSRMSVFSVGIVIRFFAMLLLTAIMVKKGEIKELFKIKSIWKSLILIGILGFLLDITAFLGLSLCPAGIGTVLLKSDIVFVNFISVVFYRYRFSKGDWFYTIVMLLGIVLTLGIDFSNVQLGGAGNFLFIASALFVSINAFVIQGVLHRKKGPVSGNVVAFYNNFITLILFTGFACFNGDIIQLGKFGESTYLTAALLLAALGQTLVYVVYYHNLRCFPVWIVKVFLLLMPVVTAVLSYFVFDEKLVGVQYLGMAIVLLCAGGIVLEQRKKEKLQAKPQPEP